MDWGEATRDEGNPLAHDYPALTDKHFAAIGRVTVAAAWMDEELDFLCTLLLGSGRVKAFEVLQGMMTVKLIALAQRLLSLDEHGAHFQSRAEDLFKECEALARERNNVVHSLTLAVSGNDDALGRIDRRKANGSVQLVSVARMVEVAEAFHLLNFKLAMLHNDILVAKRTRTGGAWNTTA